MIFLDCIGDIYRVRYILHPVFLIFFILIILIILIVNILFNTTVYTFVYRLIDVGVGTNAIRGGSFLFLREND